MYHEAYTGPPPTKYYESPMSAALVKQGKLPPVEQRLPIPSDVGIVGGPEGIGEYGGYYRMTSGGNYIGEWIVASWNTRDSMGGVKWFPWVGKSWEVSDDGRVWTFKLRRGMKWSDGTPFTMESIQFAWEDNNLDKSLTPVAPMDFRDPVTGTDARFQVVDDNTWTLTYDTPVFTIMESRSTPSNICGPGRYCMYAHPGLKKYYPQYSNQAQVDQYMKEENVADWRSLLQAKYHIYNNMIEIGCMAPFCAVLNEVGIQTEWERNHYYMFVDPEGNQIPYLDGAIMPIVEDRDVTVFRAMSGENDGRTSPFLTGELPLYAQNMERGDYSLYLWPSSGGADLGISLNQTWNEDPYIGQLIRTKDFRLALSHALDGNQLNETVLAGIGIVQNRVPPSHTPYYPGDEYAMLNTEYDMAKANRLLDGLGLTAKDKDGFRTRPDGDGPIELFFVISDNPAVVQSTEIAQSAWRELGIKLSFQASAAFYADIRLNLEYGTINRDYSAYQANPWMVDWTSLAPLVESTHLANDIGRWYGTAGQAGMGPTGPDPAFKPLAQPGNFPADPSGMLKKLSESWIAGKSFSNLDPRRIELGKDLFRINAEELFSINKIGFSGIFRGIYLNRNNLRGKPVTHERDHNGFTAWAHWFEDGWDNYHHPGNRSKECTSWAFVQGGMPECS